MKKVEKAFTLVELIVVITILAILGTIGFLSFQNYNSYARDTIRTSDLSLIARWIKIKQVQWGYVLKPENFVEITASGTIIWYQWEFTTKIWNKYKLNWDFKDPLDEQNYVYSVDKNLNNFTIWGFLESDEVALSTEGFNPLENTYAREWRTLKTFGDKFWIILKDWEAVNSSTDLSDLTDSKINILDTALTSNYELFLDDNETVTWTGLVAMNSKASCKRILELWNDWPDWVYKINPTGDNEFEVYCDMTTDWGGWTLVMNFNRNSINSQSYPWTWILISLNSHIRLFDNQIKSLASMANKVRIQEKGTSNYVETKDWDNYTINKLRNLEPLIDNNFKNWTHFQWNKLENLNYNCDSNIEWPFLYQSCWNWNGLHIYSQDHIAKYWWENNWINMIIMVR